MFPHYHSSEITPTTLKLLFIVTKIPASSKSPTRNLYSFLSLCNEVLCDLVRLWAPPILPVCFIEFLMPLSWCVGSWLFYFLIQVNYLIVFAFNLALGNPVVRDTDLIRISCLSGKMTFHFDKGKNHGTLTMTLSGEAFTYYLTMVLRTTPLKSWERQPPSQEVHILQVSRPGIMQIPPTPAHPPSDLWIVPPGVPFRISCPHCQYPLEREEYCMSHRAEGITVLCCSPKDSLEEHNRNPFLIFPGIHYPVLHEELHSSPETTIISLDSVPGLSTTPSSSSTSTQQHAHSLPACFPSSPNICTNRTTSPSWRFEMSSWQSCTSFPEITTRELHRMLWI